MLKSMSQKATRSKEAEMQDTLNTQIEATNNDQADDDLEQDPIIKEDKLDDCTPPKSCGTVSVHNF